MAEKLIFERSYRGTRGYRLAPLDIEGKGIAFGARAGGKIKMALQSTAIPCVLFYQANFAHVNVDSRWRPFFYWLAWGFVAATLVVTVLSAVHYIWLSIRTLKPGGDSSESSGDSSLP